MFNKMLVSLAAVAAIVLSPVARGDPASGYQNGPAASNAGTSLTLLYQNNFNASDDVNHVGAILLDPLARNRAGDACKAVGEKLLSKSTLDAHKTDFEQALSYNSYAGHARNKQAYYIDRGTVSVNRAALKYGSDPRGKQRLPVLCTQSTNSNKTDGSVANKGNQITVSSNGNSFVGYRNQKSFRFSGIPFADKPARFEYSKLSSERGQTIQATAYGSECAQTGIGSEDCLFLNIQTPYIPKAGSKAQLRPVMFWIYGGGFTGGSGSDPLSDGGNLASREDIVVVQVNYRLSSLGFLAIPGTDIKGNYGISDQITGLEWVIKNIAQFGGDPKRITINGESAGAGSVRTLLGSPQAIGKFQGAIAMSNLGGGVDLGLTGNYATTYSSYLSIPALYDMVGQDIFKGVNCTQGSLDEQIDCLKKAPAADITNLGAMARFVVQDGFYVNTEELDVANRNGSAAFVPVMFGNVADDGASFSTYPTKPVTSEVAGIQATLGISQAEAQSIIDSKLFPYYDTGNITLDSFNVSQRVATDNEFRCVDQATVYAGIKSHAFKSAYYFQMQRTINGYDPNNLGGPPASPGYPNGNPNLPYFRLHGADMPWVFGTLSILRDANDLYSTQLESAYFAEFVKSGQPNPPDAYLRVRGYDKTREAIQKTGPWDPVRDDKGPMRLLDYPSVKADFQDQPQCAFLNYSISYYLDGGL